MRSGSRVVVSVLASYVNGPGSNPDSAVVGFFAVSKLLSLVVSEAL